MSLKEWGQFLDSFKTRAEATAFIFECNKALVSMDVSDEDRFAIRFTIHPTFDNVQGRQWLYAVYMTLDRENP